MAKVKFNQIAQASGKVNGTIYATGIGGQYMKNWKSPANPQSTRQSEVRADLSGLASAWRTLTDAQRLAWVAAVDGYPQTNVFGDTYTPSGYQLYMTLNMNLVAAGQSTINVPASPASVTGATLTDLTMELTAGVLTTGTLTTSTAGAATETDIIELTGSVSAGIQSAKSVVFKFTLADSGDENPHDLEPFYTNLFGQPLVGSRVFARAFRVNNTTGQRLSLGSISTIVTTL